MFVVSNFVYAAARVLDSLLYFYTLIVIASAVVSWVNADPYNPIVRFLRGATEPVMYRVRRVLPVVFGGIDFTPLVVILIIQFLQFALVQSLYDVSRQLKVG